MKRTLSLILSLLMVLSLFTGLNVGAGYQDDKGTYTFTNVAEGTYNLRVPQDVPLY